MKSEEFLGKSDKLLLIIGPCSADREDAVLDYLTRLSKVQEKVKDKIMIIPRVYTNKPRTTGGGYKGLVHQPDPEKKPDMLQGIIAVRELHQRAILESGLTCADEMLYPENHRYVSDLLSYVAIGARSVEDQQHRLTASGVGIAVGMKNPTGGDLSVMMKLLLQPHRDSMYSCIVDGKYRFLLPQKIVDAHEAGIIHFHDSDYFAQHMHNCCSVNLEDMLQNGTVISDVMIEKPKSFSTACNIATQAVAQIASSQYGGQSITLSHLVPFVEISRQKYRRDVRAEFEVEGMELDEQKINEIAEMRVRKEVKQGVQVIQYQVITLMTTNGQAPFVTVFMYLDEVEEGPARDDLAMIIEEMLNQDYCQCCGYEGEIQIITDEHGKLIWECPNCGNQDQAKMNVARRTCGYIGTQFWNQGRTQEIKERVMHL